MRFFVEPSPRGGWHVRVEGSDRPLSHHDTEEEAERRANAYARGVSAGKRAMAESERDRPEDEAG